MAYPTTERLPARPAYYERDANSDSNVALKLLALFLGLSVGVGGGVFDVKIARPGIYPFVSHSFASVNLGEVGLLNVGHVAGTMSH